MELQAHFPIRVHDVALCCRGNSFPLLLLQIYFTVLGFNDFLQGKSFEAYHFC